MFVISATLLFLEEPKGKYKPYFFAGDAPAESSRATTPLTAASQGVERDPAAVGMDARRHQRAMLERHLTGAPPLAGTIQVLMPSCLLVNRIRRPSGVHSAKFSRLPCSRAPRPGPIRNELARRTAVDSHHVEHARLGPRHRAR